MSRTVAKFRGDPVGGSVSSDSGQIPNPSGIDHEHSFWQKWIQLPLLQPWVGGLYYSTCGNIVWIRGNVHAEGTIYTHTNIATLPKAVRPKYVVLYPSLVFKENDLVIVIQPISGLIFCSLGGNIEPPIVAHYTTVDIDCDDVIYRIMKN